MSSSPKAGKTVQDFRLLNRKQAAEFIKARVHAGSVSLLAKLARNNAGPEYRVINNRALYRQADVETWLLDQWNKPTLADVSQSRGRIIHEPPTKLALPEAPVVEESSSSGIDLEAIEQGLRLVARLGA